MDFENAFELNGAVKIEFHTFSVQFWDLSSAQEISHLANFINKVKFSAIFWDYGGQRICDHAFVDLGDVIFFKV